MISATALCCAAATSGLAAAVPPPTPPTQVVIDQVQLGDVTANQTLNVVEIPSGVSQATATVGNAALGTADHAALDYRATQTLNGESHAVSNVQVADSAGDGLYVSTSATGNTGTAGTCCKALTGSSSQTIAANHAVTAEAYVYTGGPTPTGEVSVDASAIGNTQGWETNGGSIQAASTQAHYGETYSALGAVVGAVDGNAAYSSTAVANNVTSDATGAPVHLIASQETDGFRTRADIDVQQDSATAVAAVATATSNNINITSSGSSASLFSDQFNTNPVQTEVVLSANWWGDTATASAYSVANSALVSNAGAFTSADGLQTNTGAVSAVTSFNGGAGGDAAVLGTAVGNAWSAYACADCNGSVLGTVRQTNSGGVSTTVSTTTSAAGFVAASAMAVGNSATVQVHKP